MAQTRTPAAERSIDVDDVSRVLDQNGERIRNADLDRFLAGMDVAEMQGLYRDMVVVRRIDAEGMALQRQGQLALWAPCQGQEAAQVGTAHAVRSDDFIFPSYREIGVNYVRGAELVDFVRAWRGEEHSSFDPYDINVATPQIIIGAQTLHAVGYAMGIQNDETDQVAVTYFGDGATSQGDVNEAMIFASSFGAPVVFVCSNNHWAISEPVSVQSRFPIAGRAPGFGIPSLRIDGNDVLACIAAMRWALDHARRGRGPVFLEAVTYRMGPHTTSDDPTRYRDAAELERWRARDPLTRLEAYLRSVGEFDDGFTADVAARGDAYAAEMRSVVLSAVSRPALSVLDHVYAEPHSGLERTRRRFAAYLDGFGDEEAGR